MTASIDHEKLAKLLRQALSKRRGAAEARRVNDEKADHALRERARELEKEAEALDPQHTSEAWSIEL